MILRPTKIEDISRVIDIINQAKTYFKNNDIDQWQDGYPNEETIEKDIAFGPNNLELSSEEVSRRVKKSMEMVGLDYETYKNVSPFDLSGGQKRRVAIAGVIAMEPKVLILDEPTVGLDPKERVKFRKLISSFASEKIVLLSTHIVSDIEYIADEIIILKKGRIENTGTITYLLKDINKCVWECLVPEKEVNRIEQVYTVSNRKYGEDGVVLRLISREKPFANAKQVDPVLEDLYLFYFREGE